MANKDIVTGVPLGVRTRRRAPRLTAALGDCAAVADGKAMAAVEIWAERAIICALKSIVNPRKVLGGARIASAAAVVLKKEHRYALLDN